MFYPLASDCNNTTLVFGFYGHVACRYSVSIELQFHSDSFYSSYMAFRMDMMCTSQSVANIYSKPNPLRDKSFCTNLRTVTQCRYPYAVCGPSVFLIVVIMKMYNYFLTF